LRPLDSPFYLFQMNFALFTKLCSLTPQKYKNASNNS